jgi:hypothetical protein
MQVVRGESEKFGPSSASDLGLHAVDTGIVNRKRWSREICGEHARPNEVVELAGEHDNDRTAPQALSLSMNSALSRACSFHYGESHRQKPGKKRPHSVPRTLHLIAI